MKREWDFGVPEILPGPLPHGGTMFKDFSNYSCYLEGRGGVVGNAGHCEDPHHEKQDMLHDGRVLKTQDCLFRLCKKLLLQHFR